MTGKPTETKAKDAGIASEIRTAGSNSPVFANVGSGNTINVSLPEKRDENLTRDVAAIRKLLEGALRANEQVRTGPRASLLSLASSCRARRLESVDLRDDYDHAHFR